ncbi:glycosyltransferase [Microbacterium koreense]|uniref:4,4'-diaponeurosporenoate glycosyltransferase n=1 Tax=Microbacterium koreense TaxID=323761 RepID=A0ABW2ZME7_9MICO
MPRWIDSATVSVVIPVKDDAVELQRCLAALDVQTRRPDEIIVVDNGSSDASPDVARTARATVVRCDRPGIPAAAARGYDRARGDVVLRLDADCVPDAGWVEGVVAAFAARPDVHVFTAGARFSDGPPLLRVPLAAGYLVAYAAVSASALGHLPLFGSNLAFHRSAWQDVRAAVHRRDAAVHDDLDLAFHLGELHRIRLLPRAHMTMSMRPFSSLRGFASRIGRGFRTVVIHWPADFPPVRWVRLVLRRVLARGGVPTRRAVRR